MKPNIQGRTALDDAVSSARHLMAAAIQEQTSIRSQLADDELCSICLERLKNGAYLSKTQCAHVYHVGCLLKVRDSKCPLCRRVIFGSN